MFCLTRVSESSVVFNFSKIGQFLHTNRILNFINGRVKEVGRNKIAVQFSAAGIANIALKGRSANMHCMCKYV